MKQDEVLTKLIRHRPELEALGIEHLSLFGSVARGSETVNSDIDILAEFKPSARVGFSFAGIKRRLEELLGSSVDLLAAPIEKTRLKEQIESESVRAF